MNVSVIAFQIWYPNVTSKIEKIGRRVINQPIFDVSCWTRSYHVAGLRLPHTLPRGRDTLRPPRLRMSAPASLAIGKNSTGLLNRTCQLSWPSDHESVYDAVRRTALSEGRGCSNPPACTSSSATDARLYTIYWY